MADELYYLHEEFGREISPELYERIKKFIGHYCAPEDIFSGNTLEQWAFDNGWLKPEEQT